MQERNHVKETVARMTTTPKCLGWRTHFAMNWTTRKKDEHSFKKELPSDNEPEQETDFIDVLNHLEDTDLEEGCPTDIFRLPIPESCPKTIGLSSAYQYAF